MIPNATHRSRNPTGYPKLTMKTISTERLTLRPVGEQDYLFIAKLMNERGYLNNVGDRGVRTPDDAAAYVATAVIYLYSKDLGFNLVELRSCGTPVGICGLVARGADGVVEIGYGFLDREAGKGYATEAARATVDYAFRMLGLGALHGITNESNGASRRVLEKLGMTLVEIEPNGKCIYQLFA